MLNVRIEAVFILIGIGPSFDMNSELRQNCVQLAPIVVMPIENNPLPGQLIQRRGGDPIVAITTDGACLQTTRDEDDDLHEWSGRSGNRSPASSMVGVGWVESSRPTRSRRSLVGLEDSTHPTPASHLLKW